MDKPNKSQESGNKHSEVTRKFEFENTDGDHYVVRFNEKGFATIDSPQWLSHYSPYYKEEMFGYALFMFAPDMCLWMLSTPSEYIAGIGNPFRHESWKEKLNIEDEYIIEWLKEQFKDYLKGEDWRYPVIFSSDEITITGEKNKLSGITGKYSEVKNYVGNILLTIHGNGWWDIRFAGEDESSILEGLGNPFTDTAFNKIRGDFICDVGRKNSDWLRKMFEQHYDDQKINHSTMNENNNSDSSPLEVKGVDSNQHVFEFISSQGEKFIATIHDMHKRLRLKYPSGAEDDMPIKFIVDGSAKFNEQADKAVKRWIHDVVKISDMQQELVVYTKPVKMFLFNGLSGQYCVRHIEGSSTISLTLPKLTITGEADDLRTLDFFNLLENGQLLRLLTLIQAKQREEKE